MNEVQQFVRTKIRVWDVWGFFSQYLFWINNLSGYYFQSRIQSGRAQERLARILDAWFLSNPEWLVLPLRTCNDKSNAAPEFVTVGYWFFSDLSVYHNCIIDSTATVLRWLSKYHCEAE